MKYTIYFEEIEKFPLELFINAEGKFPIYLGLSSLDKVAAECHGFRIDTNRRVIDLEILFNNVGYGLLAQQIFSNNRDIVKLNPLLRKNYMDDEFVNMELRGFLISNMPEVVTIPEYRFTKKSLIGNIYNKITSWLK